MNIYRYEEWAEKPMNQSAVPMETDKGAVLWFFVIRALIVIVAAILIF